VPLRILLPRGLSLALALHAGEHVPHLRNEGLSADAMPWRHLLEAVGTTGVFYLPRGGVLPYGKRAAHAVPSWHL
jgi:hypothetical protein